MFHSTWDHFWMPSSSLFLCALYTKYIILMFTLGRLYFTSRGVRLVGLVGKNLLIMYKDLNYKNDLTLLIISSTPSLKNIAPISSHSFSPFPFSYLIYVQLHKEYSIFVIHPTYVPMSLQLWANQSVKEIYGMKGTLNIPISVGWKISVEIISVVRTNFLGWN